MTLLSQAENKMGNLYIANSKLALSGSDYTIDTDDLTKWSANWLDAAFAAHIWNFKNFKTPLNFNVRFVNGEYLTNPKYSSLLNTIKKVVFLKRSGHYADMSGSQSSRSQTQHRLGRDLISMAQFLVNSDYYREGEGFASMTKPVFDEFIQLFVKAGLDAVSGNFDIVKNKLAKLEATGKINKVLDKKGFFSKEAFISVTGIESECIDYLSAISKDNLKPYCLFKEHEKSISGINAEYNNATPLKESRQESKSERDDGISSIVSDSRLSSFIASINSLSNLQIPLKDSELAYFSAFKASIKDYEGLYYETRRTPNIPTDIALAYIDSAVEFVHQHGANLLETLADCKRQIANEIATREKPRKDHVMKAIKVPVNSTTKHFNVKRYNGLKRGSTPQDKREEVTVEILLEVFQAAVFILLATFACKRFNDVIPVKHGANTIGYTGLNFIKFGLSKADPLEILRAVGRPVPRIVADAFDNLAEINNILLNKAESPSTSLFQAELIIPSSLTATNEKEITRDVLRRRLVIFADFVQIPTVVKGGVESRWYLNRMHMLRRFFACAYYTTLGKKNIPALTWLMGHADTLQTMRYVTQDLSNLDMNNTETAGVIAAAMTDLDGDTDVLDTLSEAIGEPKKTVRIAANERRLEKRVTQLLNKGYRVIREESGAFTLLHSLKNEDEGADAE